ncbi:MAG: 50S ribosomal protein L29 [Candidatus Zambryskibacteria bacterium RIFCSPLOWO2_02_FULL_39_26]|uniref:Large ribosomal subunit protein uL29 n=1 Tax=Candidatus Zambryskibacteria bacterium RIFCSPLOWO2_12_FULL_39_23 TaxID=1802776 RepID=A0A1G2UST2_9BACT|nr:MAG: 50S ribosomal protein L29 [Candidatus Zambryskibacteria bacterium RIFCSPHIGHO2_02_39_10]OHA99616.1 MAG: 50S ribosomal protein L29 [Candidatus Zambryskibacteria bacterium RIFCSPHIGHO2_12_FULL_39_47]OHB10119.1 MAG: 50S ribosomal protein L29 [Candidatus Zambryskibacteria bacterium RIFCSPLOWO2_02_FULL_39_26]OHB12434.1 MAG: 50S ribosomal protein L29 [Candidatus Zambryskibacteria bacterium RIFCSPLOWO2_12_FULL_39_23]
MKIKELKSKNPKELNSLLSEKTSALRAFRFAVAGSNVRNVKEGLTLKKDIARIKTILNNIK